MRQLIKRILREETERDLSPVIEKLLETNIVPKYKGIVCGVKVTAPHNRDKEPNQQFELIHYKIEVFFIGGHGTNFWPKTMAIREMYDKIMFEMWNSVESYIGEPTDVYATYIKECDNNINEEVESDDPDYSPKTIQVIEKLVKTLDLPRVDSIKVEWLEEQGIYKIKLCYLKDYNEFRSIVGNNERKVEKFVIPFMNLPPYTISVGTYVCRPK